MLFRGQSFRSLSYPRPPYFKIGEFVNGGSIFGIGTIEAKLLASTTRLERFMAIFFPVYIGQFCRFESGTRTGLLRFYLVKCRRHNKLFVDYPHSHESRFDCPECLKSRIGDIRLKNVNSDSFLPPAS